MHSTPILLIKINHSAPLNVFQEIKEYLGVKHFSNVVSNENFYFISISGDFDLEEIQKKYESNFITFSKG